MLGLEKYGMREGKGGPTRLDRGQVARFKHGCADESDRLIVKDQGLAPVASVARDTHTPETENDGIKKRPGGAARAGNNIAELGLPRFFLRQRRSPRTRKAQKWALTRKVAWCTRGYWRWNTPK